MKKDYPWRKREKREGSRPKSSSAIAESDVSDDLSMLLVGHKEEADRWILNSASSYHCTPYRAWFASYMQVGHGQQVTLGDGNSYDVAGAGSIRLRIFDERVWTLTNVHHVSDLRGSVVSLGYLEEKGFIFKSDSRMLNVSKSSRIVIRGKRLRSWLY